MLRCVYSWLGKFAASHSIQSSVGTAAGVEDARAKNKKISLPIPSRVRRHLSLWHFYAEILSPRSHLMSYKLVVLISSRKLRKL